MLIVGIAHQLQRGLDSANDFFWHLQFIRLFQQENKRVSCIQPEILNAMSAVLAAAETFADTTGSSLAHWIQHKSRVSFAFRESLSNFLLNTASRKAAAASESVTKEPEAHQYLPPPRPLVWPSCWDGVSGQQDLNCCIACRNLTVVGVRHCVWPRAQASLVCPVWT